VASGAAGFGQSLAGLDDPRGGRTALEGKLWVQGLMAGLQLVQENIASFGGNPNQVKPLSRAAVPISSGNSVTNLAWIDPRRQSWPNSATRTRTPLRPSSPLFREWGYTARPVVSLQRHGTPPINYSINVRA
jgi:hypothetical protein